MFSPKRYNITAEIRDEPDDAGFDCLEAIINIIVILLISMETNSL